MFINTWQHLPKLPFNSRQNKHLDKDFLHRCKRAIYLIFRGNPKNSKILLIEFVYFVHHNTQGLIIYPFHFHHNDKYWNTWQHWSADRSAWAEYLKSVCWVKKTITRFSQYLPRTIQAWAGNIAFVRNCSHRVWISK